MVLAEGKTHTSERCQVQWRPVHKEPPTRIPTLRPQDVHGFLAWERHLFLDKTIGTQETQDTLEANR
eukprot:7394638-Pyramimonas_sp.AAC.1